MWRHLKQKSITVPKITAEEISTQVEPVLRTMEEHGIKLDVKEFKKLAKKLSADSLKLQTEIIQLSGDDFNIDSPSQMADILFNKLKLPSIDLKRTKSGPSTAASELNKIKDCHPIIAPILEYRELSKLLSTYLKPLPLLADENSRLHTHYAQDAATGRISSNNPNLQNIPIKGKWGDEIRRAFIAPQGKVLIAADYSQIELRIVACLSEDKAMIESFTTGRDVHTETASDVFNKKPEEVTPDERRFAKTINFGVLYGMSPYGLSQALGIATESAAEYIRRYNQVYAGIRQYCLRMIAEAKDKGYVETLFGMKRYLPNIKSHNRYLAESEERMAINTPVQGTAAEILKLAMIELHKKLTADSLKLKAKLLLTVHDELVVEAPEERAEEIAAIVRESMENVIKLCIPIEVEVGIGKDWAECKEK